MVDGTAWNSVDANLNISSLSRCLVINDFCILAIVRPTCGAKMNAKPFCQIRRQQTEVEALNQGQLASCFTQGSKLWEWISVNVDRAAFTLTVSFA